MGWEERGGKSGVWREGWVDVWALGVCLYKILFLQDLFGVPGEEKLAVLNFDVEKRVAILGH